MCLDHYHSSQRIETEGQGHRGQLIALGDITEWDCWSIFGPAYAAYTALFSRVRKTRSVWPRSPIEDSYLVLIFCSVMAPCTAVWSQMQFWFQSQVRLDSLFSLKYCISLNIARNFSASIFTLWDSCSESKHIHTHKVSSHRWRVSSTVVFFVGIASNLGFTDTTIMVTCPLFCSPDCAGFVSLPPRLNGINLCGLKIINGIFVSRSAWCLSKWSIVEFIRWYKAGFHGFASPSPAVNKKPAWVSMC